MVASTIPKTITYRGEKDAYIIGLYSFEAKDYNTVEIGERAHSLHF